MNTAESFFAQTKETIDLFNEWIKPFVSQARADHIGYKCETTEEFERLRALLEPSSSFLYQSFISGRRIAFFKFRPALFTVAGDVCFLELSDQKPDGSQKSGFDHLELYPLTGSVELLVKVFEANRYPFTQAVRPHHTTYDRKLTQVFTMRIEPEPLLEKIVRQELSARS